MSKTPDLIGYRVTPLYAPKPGTIITQAIILCYLCGGTVDTRGGPCYNAVCLECAKKKKLTNFLVNSEDTQ